MNVALKLPPEFDIVLAIGVPSNSTVTDAEGRKLDPVTVTEVPTKPFVGFSDIVAGWVGMPIVLELK